METIKHANIIYMPTISPLGGIETYVWEIVKKYHDLDIAVVSKTCDPKQARRIKKYCKLYIHTNQDIECKVAIINYDVGIINYINEGAKIYQTIHGDYTHESYDKMPPKHERITAYIAITKYLEDRMKEVLHTDKVIMSYNPLTIEKEEKPLITLVSATRLNFRKGKGRMIELAKALDKANVNYIWYVFTNDEESIESPNVIFLKNRLDVSRWISRADYLVQLSDTEACSYAINEMLYRNKPVIVTPLPYLKEIGFEDKKNGYVLNFDCSNIQDIVDNIYNIPKFTFKQLEDKYRDIFAPSKSTYVPEKDCGKDVIAIHNFTLENFDEVYNLVRVNKYRNLDGHIYAGDRFSCSQELFDYLTGGNREGVKVIKEID